MGLMLGPGAYYAETGAGAHLLTHDGEFALTGRSVYRLLDRLAPALNGQYSLAELTAQLSPERREMVGNLVTALIERSAVRDIGPTSAPDDGPAGHEHEVAFTGYFQSRAAAAFRRYQETPTLVIGAGSVSAAVAVAASRSGLRDVRVVTTAECGTAAGDPAAVPDTDAAIASLLDGVRLVLHATDEPMVRRARLLDRLCADRGIDLAQVLLVGDHAWMAGRPGDGWSAGWRRVEAWRPGTPRGSAAPRPGPGSVTAVANQLVHGVFRSITGTAPSDRSRLVRIDMSTLDSEVATYLPHPYAVRVGPVADIADRIGQLRAGPRMTPEEFSRRAVVCAGDLAGVFGDPTEREFAQLPLRVCAIDVADPVGLLGPDSSIVTVTGAGVDFATARWQAARSAFAVHASLMVDPRRLTPGGFSRIDLRADPDELLAAVRAGAVTGLLAGQRLDGDGHRLVDACQVFPALCSPGRPFVRPTGVGVGYDWDEAVTAGLVGQCRQLTIRQLAAAGTPFPRVDVDGAALDARGERYRALLATTGQPVRIYDVTGPLGVPTMIGYLGSEAAGCASSLSGVDAVVDTLEELLLYHQARSTGQRVYAPPPAPSIPSHLRGTGEAPAARRPAPDPTAATVIAALVAHGHRPVAVPLDHDREVNAVMPYTVHVVLSRD